MQTRFVEVIKEGEIVQMSREQALLEDLFILRDVIEQKQEFEASRIPLTSHRIESHASWLDKWKKGDVGNRGNNVASMLKEHFYWEVVKKRRSKGLSRGQLAALCQATEAEIKSVELGELPRDDFVLVNKLEAALGITLRKEGAPTSISLSELTKLKDERDVRPAINTAASSASGSRPWRKTPMPEKEPTTKELLGDDIEIVG